VKRFKTDVRETESVLD